MGQEEGRSEMKDVTEFLSAEMSQYLDASF